MALKKHRYPVAIVAGRLCIACLCIIALPCEIFAQRQNTVPAKGDTTQPYRPNRRPSLKPSDRYGDPFSNQADESPLYLKDPNRHKLDVEIDTGFNYTVYEKIGDLNYRPTTTMSFQEFRRHQEREMLKEYWQSRSRALDGESAVSGRGFTPKIFISPVFDRIFGGSYVELIPRGFVSLDFGGQWQKVNNPAIPARQQRNGGLQFNPQISMSVVGKVGEKLAVTANFDTNNSFDFQNNLKVEYTGFKEDILQKLEIGNVSLPLNNTLIQGAQNLFGVKTQMQFGKLNVTSIASTQRGKVASINIPGGNKGQGRPFEIIGSNYDENRHFFLGHFFRENYERWIANLPQITSGVYVQRVEVYVLNRNSDTQTLRNVVGLMDLGEARRIYNKVATPLPNDRTYPNANEANGLYNAVKGFNRNADNINASLDGLNMLSGTDYEKITGARKLAPTEFTYHPQLGYITLVRKLQNDEVVAVAYEYSYNGGVYKVGEISSDYGNLKDEEVVFLKLLRPRKIATRDQDKVIIPTWDLMMKNIYSLNISQLTRENFQLKIIYRDDRTGIDNPQLQEGKEVRNHQLIELLGLDKLNPVNDPQRDGNFDYVEGITINSQNGLIIFPYLEPFNKALRRAFASEPDRDFLIQKYVYDTLYRTTKADAELFATKNKFFILGQYSAGSSREISIPGFGVSPGSVRVFAGGTPLMEGTQYIVDYTLGKVTILDESILNSGKNVTIDYEQADPFAFQTRSLLGTRLDYKLSEEVNLGSTLLYYNERPLISRNLIGTEPARNVMYGVDFNVNKTSRVLTKLVDAIPILQTKEPSSVSLSGEFAQLLPGTSNVIDGEGTAYVDDFENTATPYSLISVPGWKLASVPKTEDNRFADSQDRTVAAGYKRAKLAWYQIDNLFYRTGGRLKPSNIPKDVLNHYVRGVGQQEIFPNRQLQQGVVYEPIFDLAYYPAERGPYNYNPDLLPNGLLPRPEESWAAITNAIRTEVDFDKANIEYVEFWLLDPFLNISGSTNDVIDDGIHPPKAPDKGGKLIFQLGSISEDVMRDSRHAFENGLPPDGNLVPPNAASTRWGYVTSQQYLTNAFDNSGASRANQDVGFDGVPDPKEAGTFPAFTRKLDSINSIRPFETGVLSKLNEDPSGDNFKYFLDAEFDAKSQLNILERYKNYNGLEGNTPLPGNDLITRSGSPYPDNEDLNADNTLSELEEYYEYDIDLKPGLNIGREYIVDKTVTSNNEAKEEVTWYLFRIPVREFENRYGNITGFKSIRYVRMVLTGFQEPVVLRFANFRMVGSKWRRYLGDISDGGLKETLEPNRDNFSVSVVNLEENGQGDAVNFKSPYRIPPGVLRDRDNTSTVPRQLNEQSVQVCVDELQDGDSRAIYKYVESDFFNYGRIKMFLHADSKSNTNDDELHAFVRLGTDFDQNYYEIEVPLKISEGIDPINPDLREIWPLENEIDLDLNELYALKAARDRGGFALTELYPREGPRQVGNHLLRIFGRPDLSAVRVMMIGIRNPNSPDKRTHTVCIWANELRLTDFNRKAGWAINAALNAKLADFATVTGAIRHTTFGFGSVSSKIGERAREETTAYDVTANVNVDKLLPGNSGIKIPMFVGYENTTINPNFDPANPDLKLDAALKSFNTEEQRTKYVDLIRDQSVRRSLNFTNVRKVKVKQDAKPHIYDIENLAFSYSFSEATQRNFNIKESLQQQQRASVAYNFAPKETGIEPFKNFKGMKSPYLKLIKDFNFGLMPSNLSVRGDLDRSFNKTIYRNDGGRSETANFQKYFIFNRDYNMRWSLSKGLTLDYTAHVNAIIDEPEGEIDTQEKRDSIIANLKKFGRMKNFDQSVTANYTIPLDKIPFTNWTNAEYRYQVNYSWRAGPINKPDKPDSLRGFDDQDIDDALDFRNTIQNTREQNFSGRLDLVKLYNKVKFLKEINTPPRPVTNRPTAPGRLPQKPVPKADTVKKASLPGPLKGLLRLLMSVRSVNGTYTRNEGTILPGFKPSPFLFGVDRDFNAPGIPFVLGSQDPNIRMKAATNDWLVQRDSLTMPFSQQQSTMISIKANVDPSTDFKMQIDIRKDANTSYQEIFRYNAGGQYYESINPGRGGSYKISTISIKTALVGDNDEIKSSVFTSFEENLQVVRGRFNAIGQNQTEHDTTSQDVLIPAFIAAYTGKNANIISLSPFPSSPLPNWRVDYTGLSKIKALKEVFQTITVTHAYSSSYSVVNYSNSLRYNDPSQVGINVPVEDYNRTHFANVTNEQGELIPTYLISQVMISEQFAPLIGINIRTKGRVTAKVEYKTKRDISLNIPNAQVTELNNRDMAFELGFTKNNMKLPFKSQGRTVVLKNDVTFRMNFTVSNTKTIQRKIDEPNMITNGNINLQLRPNINYAVNQKLNIQLYFERSVNEPLISNSFRRSTTKFGTQIRFNLAQ